MASSSGKIYYFNLKSQESTWSKPAEWRKMEAEKQAEKQKLEAERRKREEERRVRIARQARAAAAGAVSHVSD